MDGPRALCCRKRLRYPRLEPTALLGHEGHLRTYRRCAEEYMSVASFNIRAAVARDAAACAATAYAAHARVSAVHNFPPELPTLEVATRFIRSKLENSRCRGYGAEKDGYVVGSVFVT